LTFLHVDMRKQKKLICNFTFKIHVPVLRFATKKISLYL
jgi:hypothetical protein